MAAWSAGATTTSANPHLQQREHSPSVASGAAHTCGLRSDATVVCWGRNVEGQSSPLTPLSTTFTQVSAGRFNTCGVRTGGTVVCWGNDGFGQLAVPSGSFTRVSVGGLHVCGVRPNQTLACWGFNSNGQTNAPTGRFSGVSAGDDHSCGVRTDGTVVCWGSNGAGQASPPWGTFTTVDSGATRSCGVRSDQQVVCWGSDLAGGATPPAGPFAAVTAGGDNACGLTSQEVVVCWGSQASLSGSPAPGPPTNVRARVVAGSATVSWTPPVDDAGSPVTGYTVTVWPGGAGCTSVAPATSCGVAGLSQSAAVRFTVTATNARGSSMPSAGTIPVVPGVCGVVPTAFSDELAIPKFAKRGASCLSERDITTNDPYNAYGAVSRAQMAAFLWRMAGSPPSPSSCGFADESFIPLFARPGACWLKAEGITTVNPTIRPGS